MSERTDPGRVRRRVLFSGQVQGVFFRATSREISQKFNVVGYVRNLADGRVELEAEGPAEQIDEFIAAVQRRFEGNVTRTEKQDVPARGDEDGFEIQY